MISFVRAAHRSFLAAASWWMLVLIALFSFAAPVLAPYHYDNEDRAHSYAPPTAIHWYNADARRIYPFVYANTLSFDAMYRRVYTEVYTKKYPLRFFKQHRVLTVEAPARLYLWGADSRGRDIFSRTAYGAAISISAGLLGALLSFGIGMFAGGISGYAGGRTDAWMMRFCEVLMMVPGFYLLLALRAVMPPSLTSAQMYLGIVVIMSFIGWAGIARVVRGMTLSLKERPYVHAARIRGVGDLRIVLTHILPHTFSYLAVAMMLSIPGFILSEAGLSFIGLGIQDPTPSLGNMLSEAMDMIRIANSPWILMPGVIIILASLSCNVLGETLRDHLDPRGR
jgi:peptide/nickel transport system permease protein